MEGVAKGSAKFAISEEVYQWVDHWWNMRVPQPKAISEILFPDDYTPSLL